MKLVSLAMLAALVAVAAPASAGEKYALVVGVEKYVPTELPSLEYAEDDAMAIGRALEGLGFSVITMTTVSDNPRQRSTTAARILEQVEARLEDRDRSDTVVLAFSGHGLQFKGDGEFYFCPGEAELRDRATLVPMSRVMAEIGRCAAGRKLVLVDACRNELTPEAAAKSGAVIELEPAVGFRAEPPKGTIALFSCQPREKSYELKQFGHSVFTHHVVEYLTGRAGSDRYPRQEVSVEELVPFVRNRTRESASKILGASQKPEALAPDAKIPDWSLGTLGEGRRPAPGDLASLTLRPAVPTPGAGGVAPPQVKVETNSINMKLVLIPDGEFMMGGTETNEQLKAAGISVWGNYDTAVERPVHRVRITRPFWMGQTEVTLGQFLTFYHDGHAGTLDCERDGTGGQGLPALDGPQFRPWSWGHPSQTNSHPVVNVSWNDCVAFCTWLSRKEGRKYRLPTEAEWEYACRAGTATRFWIGDNPEALADVENVADASLKEFYNNGKQHIRRRDGHVHTAPVGSYRANPFGLFDMDGNVCEWCGDWYDKAYYARSPAADPTGPADGSDRVVRGGCWSSPPEESRTAERGNHSPTRRKYVIGFRVVCELE